MKTKLLSVLLALLVIFSLTACGGNGGSDNIIEIGDYKAEYKSSKVVKDSEDNDAIAITFDYTNNSKQDQSFLWAFTINLKQGEDPLEYAAVFVSEDSYDFLDDATNVDVKPGETKEVTITYKLKDLTTPVDIEATDLFQEKKDTLTIDMSTVEK